MQVCFSRSLAILLSNLAETHESLSRTLDEIMKFHLQQQEVLINYDKHYSSLSWTSYQKASELVGVLNDLFQMLSMELYRKQMLTNSIACCVLVKKETTFFTNFVMPYYLTIIKITHILRS